MPPTFLPPIEGVDDTITTLAATMLACFATSAALYACASCGGQSAQHRVHADEAEGIRAFARIRYDDGGGNGNDVADADANAEGEGEPDAAPLCPICIDPCVAGVETNCAHTFCSGCFIALWRHRHRAAVRCPCCRRPVTTLLRTGPTAAGDEAQAETDREVAAFNRRFSGAPRRFIEYVRDIPVLLRWAFLEPSFASRRMRVLLLVFLVLLGVILTALYVVLPFDLLPESTLGAVGLVDDVAAVLALVVYVGLLLRQHTNNRAQLGGGGVGG
jgi:uncharacterized membrane protein YkvA (DUF1232 family)